MHVPEEHIIVMYEGGWSLAEIASRYHKHPSSIRHTLVRNGVKLRPRGSKEGNRFVKRVSDKEVELCVRLYRKGLSLADVADVVGVTERAISWRLKKIAGEPIRPRSESIRLSFQRRPRRDRLRSS